jgi:hypothetical protein
MCVNVSQTLHCVVSNASISCDPWWNPAAEEQGRFPELVGFSMNYSLTISLNSGTQSDSPYWSNTTCNCLQISRERHGGAADFKAAGKESCFG